MAYPQYTSSGTSSVSATTPHQYYVEGQTLFNREAPLISMVDVVLGSSDSAYWTVSTGGASWGFVGEGEQVNVNAEFNIDNVVGLSLKRGIARTGFALTETVIAQMKSLNASITSDHLKKRIKQAWLGSYSATVNGLEQQAWTGTGSAISVATGVTVPGAYGITYLLNQAQTNGSYAGESLVTYPLLKVNYLNCGGTLSVTQADEGFSTILEVCSSVLDDTYCIMTTPKGEAAWKHIADINVNTGQEGSTRFNADEQPASYKLGARKPPASRKSRISYNNLPIFPNSAMFQAGLDGYSVLFSTKDVVIDTLPYDDLNMATFEGSDNMVEKFARVTKEIGLPLYYRSYANLGGNLAAYAATELQFVWMAPSRMFIWFNHATT